MSRKRIEKNLAYDDTKHLYYVYYDYGRDDEGHRIRKTKTFSSQNDAKLALLDFESSRLRGDLLVPSKITLGEWLHYWLEDVIMPNRAYTTYYGYQNMINNHISPVLGQIPLQALEPWQIQHYYTMMLRNEGLSPNTVYKHHVLLHTALQLAQQQKLLRENPVVWVEPPRQVPTRQYFYDSQQMKNLFIKVEGNSLELPVKLAGYLGLRRGEVCGLCWDAVDFGHKTLYIHVSRTVAGSRIIEKEPKTANSVRSLGFGGIPDLDMLLHKVYDKRPPRQPYVVLRPNGLPWNPNSLSIAFAEFIHANGLPQLTFHGLRHSFASVANAARVPLLDIGRALGHKDITITGRIYTHIFDQTHQEVFSTVANQIEKSQ